MSDDIPICYHCGKKIDTLRQSYGEKIGPNGKRVLVHLYQCVPPKENEGDIEQNDAQP